MTDRQRRTRIGLLIGAHVLLGLITVIVALLYPTLKVSLWSSIAYLGLNYSHVLLLGLWLGLAAARWWIKLASLVAGLTWLECLVLAPFPRPPPPPDILLGLLAVVGIPVLVVAGSAALCRRLLARIELRNEWKPRPVSEEAQYSLRSLVCLMVIIAALLALGRVFHWIAPATSNVEIFAMLLIAPVFGLTALLAAGMLTWAALGQGRVLVRVPTMLVGMALLGLMPPYFMGGPAFRYYAWPALMVTIAVCTAGSLLVIRSCGYRLVRIRSDSEADPDPTTPRTS
ncbi:MAG: hypothetical protein L0211_05340 [Planctomycetaceae bacterium]|nr:hypothetical protein [Planctomycetaceae bacterium]